MGPGNASQGFTNYLKKDDCRMHAKGVDFVTHNFSWTYDTIFPIQAGTGLVGGLSS
jgi:hypothetical protein